MSDITKSLYNIRLLDELSEKKSIIHNIHPLAKLITTIVYLIFVISFNKYEISGLLPLILFPVVLIVLSDTPLIPILNRILIVLPFVIGIGIFNPFLDRKIILVIGDISISGGFISFISILIKCILTVTASLVLIATTGMNKIALSLRILKIPKLFVMQLNLTYRYISVLIDEVIRITRAYSLRSPLSHRIRFHDLGPLTGQLLIRSIDRAQRIYQSMCIRGFEGEYNIGNIALISLKDVYYTFGWIIFFILVRYVNISNIIGLLVTGGLK